MYAAIDLAAATRIRVATYHLKPKSHLLLKIPDRICGRGFLAEDEGFEPPRTESESGVLPLH